MVAFSLAPHNVLGAFNTNHVASHVPILITLHHTFLSIETTTTQTVTAPPYQKQPKIITKDNQPMIISKDKHPSKES